MLNRYSFETLDDQGTSVSPKVTQEFDIALSMDDLLARCVDVAQDAARIYRDEEPWTDWTVELGIFLPHQSEWTLYRFPFEQLRRQASL